MRKPAGTNVNNQETNTTAVFPEAVSEECITQHRAQKECSNTTLRKRPLPERQEERRRMQVQCKAVDTSTHTHTHV